MNTLMRRLPRPRQDAKIEIVGKYVLSTGDRSSALYWKPPGACVAYWRPCRVVCVAPGIIPNGRPLRDILVFHRAFGVAGLSIGTIGRPGLAPKEEGKNSPVLGVPAVYGAGPGWHVIA